MARRRSDQDFADEIGAHIAHETDRLIADGLPPDEARGLALRRFGSVTLPASATTSRAASAPRAVRQRPATRGAA